MFNLPTYRDYQREKDPGRKLAMIILVGLRPLDEVNGWPEELYERDILQELAQECLES